MKKGGSKQEGGPCGKTDRKKLSGVKTRRISTPTKKKARKGGCQAETKGGEPGLLPVKTGRKRRGKAKGKQPVKNPGRKKCSAGSVWIKSRPVGGGRETSKKVNFREKGGKKNVFR